MNSRAALAIRGKWGHGLADTRARTTRRHRLRRRRRAAFERPEDGSILQRIDPRTGDEFLLRAQAVNQFLLTGAQNFCWEIGKISE